MRDYQSVVLAGRNTTVLTALALTTGTFIATVAVGGQVLFGTILLDIGASVAIPVTILFGVLGAIAVGVGSLAAGLASGAGIGTTVINSAVHLCIGLIGMVTYRHAVATASPSALSGPSWVPSYIIASISGASTGGAMLSWALELYGQSPFFLAIGRGLAFLAGALLFGFPLLAAARATTGFSQAPRTGGRTSWKPLAALLALPVAWVVVGTIGSIGYRSFDVLFAYDTQALRTLGVAFLGVLHDDALYGQGAIRVQAVLGGTILGLLTTVAWRSYRVHIEGIEQ